MPKTRIIYISKEAYNTARDAWPHNQLDRLEDTPAGLVRIRVSRAVHARLARQAAELGYSPQTNAFTKLILTNARTWLGQGEKDLATSEIHPV